MISRSCRRLPSIKRNYSSSTRDSESLQYSPRDPRGGLLSFMTRVYSNIRQNRITEPGVSAIPSGTSNGAPSFPQGNCNNAIESLFFDASRTFRQSPKAVRTPRRLECVALHIASTGAPH